MLKSAFRNTLYTNDNLYVLSGLNSNLVDLIYLDPPFNSKRTYSAPVGSKAAGASFKDMWTWKDVDEQFLGTLAINFPTLAKYIANIGTIHSKAMMAYLTYIAQRVIEMHRILKDTGSLYLHCDLTASHYLKLMLDCIFDKQNFGNEISWCYTGPSGA
ncbi:MAG: site-specific DNA-methyltransferase, partial [Planctomycetaceae bacterium]|nr:site-specific DNA-methyltransferase [Planctomycetaceae bacterium]